MRRLFIVAIASVLIGVGGFAQRFAQQGPRATRPRLAPPKNTAMLERWSKMSPEERQRALDKLPAERRARVERRLENYNALPAARKERLREQYQEFQRLPPERQNAMRNSFKQLNALAQDRKPIVRRELNRLRRMTPERRTRVMESGRFRERFSENERQLLFDLSNAMPNDAR